MISKTLPTILVIFTVITIFNADKCTYRKHLNKKISKKSFTLGAVTLSKKSLPLSECIHACCLTTNCTTIMYYNETSKCHLINCLEESVCTFVESGLYNSYSINKAISITNDESERTVSKPGSVWTDFLNKVASQRRLATAALVLTVLTLAALVGLGAFFCYRRKFGAASPAKGRGKYRILYNTDGDEVVGNHHPLF